MQTLSLLKLLYEQALERLRPIIAIRIGAFPAWAIITQLFIGAGWLRAATEKFIDPHWWTGGTIRDFVAAHSETTVGWYQWFLDLVVPLAPAVALTVMAGQLLAGLSLTTGRHLGRGLAAGIVMNLHFVAAGAVTPSAFYLLSQGALALWSAQHRATPRSMRRLEVVSALAALIGALSLPFISTLHPARVIDDPAAMLAFAAGLCVVGCQLASRPAISAEAQTDTFSSQV